MKREVGEEHVSMLLRSLPPRVPPAGLTTSLRVIASRERQRLDREHAVRPDLSLRGWTGRASSLQDMLRPLTLPATGGVFSAVVLFSMWVVPTYPLRAKMVDRYSHQPDDLGAEARQRLGDSRA